MQFYFLGICGVAMGHAALLLRSQGHVVMGADIRAYPPMSDKLRASGITLFEGYDAGRLAALKPDCVVVGNALSRGNPEIEYLLDSRALAFTSLPALLAEHVLGKRDTIVFAGTHGKTTTTTLAAYLLQTNGVDAGYFIGGVPCDLPCGAHLGDPTKPFVIEGDEYDCAFFDKRSKFIHYRPDCLVINNLEFDHADIFRDLADVQRSFNHVLRLVPQRGNILINGDDPRVRALDFIDGPRVWSVGEGKKNRLRIMDFHDSAQGASFSLQLDGRLWTKVRSALPGRYNARNSAMAALAAGLAIDSQQPSRLNLNGLETFRGVLRRQQCLHTRDRLTVIEDFAHHPSALSQTIEALQQRYRDHEMIVAFEPRSNTARRTVFQEALVTALSQADSVLIAPVYPRNAKKTIESLDTQLLAQALHKCNVEAEAFAENDYLLESLNQKILAKKAGRQLIVFFTNGAFDGIIQRFCRGLDTH